MLRLAILENLINTPRERDIITHPELCPVVKSPKADCRRCLNHCPTGSIKINNNTIILDEKCCECGICISACPNGVFNARRKSDFYIKSLADNVLRNQPYKPVRFVCNKISDKDVNIVTLPCIGRLTENILIDLALQGVSVEIARPNCAGCEFENANALLSDTLNISLLILKALGIQRVTIEVHGGCSDINKQVRTTDGLARRSFLKKIKNKALIKTSEVVLDLFTLKQYLEVAQCTAKAQNYKRVALVKLITNFNHRENILYPNTVVPFAACSIAESCLGCNVCSTICPVGAIQRTSDRECIKILFSEQLCTNCGLCQNSCLVRAIQLTPRICLSRMRDDVKIELIKLNKVNCRFCGEEFASINKNNNICPFCEKKRTAQTIQL